MPTSIAATPTTRVIGMMTRSVETSRIVETMSENPLMARRLVAAAAVAPVRKAGP